LDIKHLLVPCLRPGNRVLLDNAKFHYVPQTLAWREAAGATVVHLLASSSHFTPLGEANLHSAQGRPAACMMDSAIGIHRLHFAFTITFHSPFPQVTMGLVVLIMMLKSLALWKCDES
jgi:hypothetical protein